MKETENKYLTTRFKELYLWREKKSENISCRKSLERKLSYVTQRKDNRLDAAKSYQVLRDVFIVKKTEDDRCINENINTI